MKGTLRVPSFGDRGSCPLDPIGHLQPHYQNVESYQLYLKQRNKPRKAAKMRSQVWPKWKNRPKHQKKKSGKMVEEWMEATLTPSQEKSGIITKLWRNHLEQTTEQQRQRRLITSDTQKNQLQHNLNRHAQQHKRHSWQSDPQSTSWREGPTKEWSNNNQNPITSREPT